MAPFYEQIRINIYAATPRVHVVGTDFGCLFTLTRGGKKTKSNLLKVKRIKHSADVGER